MARKRKPLGIAVTPKPLRDAEYFGGVLDDYAAIGDWERLAKQARSLRQEEPDLQSLARAFETRAQAIEARLDGKITLATELEAESERHLKTYERERPAIERARDRKYADNPDGDEIELSDDEQELLVYLDELERQGLYSDVVIRKALLTGRPYFYYGVSYSQTTPESAENGDFSETGLSVDYGEGNLEDVLFEATRYYIDPRGRNDGTLWWDSQWETIDFFDSREEQHALHVDLFLGRDEDDVPKSAPLPPYVFEFINVKLGGKPRMPRTVQPKLTVGDRVKIIGGVKKGQFGTLSKLSGNDASVDFERGSRVNCRVWDLERAENPGKTAAAKRMMNPRNY